MSGPLPTPPAGVAARGPAPPGPRRRRLFALAGLLALVAAWLAWSYGERASRDWREANDALVRRDLPAALAGLERHLARRPDDAAAWFLAARTARRLERLADAERFLERCQQLGGVTDATRLEWDLLRIQRGDLRDIDRRLRATVEPDHPDAPFVLEALARGYLRCERLVDARQACTFWMRLRPDDPWPSLWHGAVCERIGQTELALEDYRRAVEKAPDDRDARLALGNALLKGHRSGEAREHFEHLLRTSPNDGEALLGLAECRLEEGRAAEAVEVLERARAADPDSPRGTFLQAKAAWTLGDAAGAEPLLRRAVRLTPDDPEALHLLVQCLRKQGADDETGPLAGRLETLRSDLRRLGELIRSVSAAPDDAGPRLEAGLVALRIGRRDEGVRWLQGALRVPGDHRPVHAALAEHYRQSGEPALAERHRHLAQAP